MKTGATLTRTNIFLSNKKVANLAVIRELSFYSQSSLGTQTGVDQLTSIGWPISGGSIVFFGSKFGYRWAYRRLKMLHSKEDNGCSRCINRDE
jgi:hypothetical protein